MSLTSPRQVNSGFYRVHLWVLLGLGTFGSLVAYSKQAAFSNPQALLGLAIATTVLCYIGSVIWLYDQVPAGMASLVIIAILVFFLLMLAYPDKQPLTAGDWCWLILDVITSSMLLGATFAAMLLGHWYLNSPTMKLDPLRWLLILLGCSLLARVLLCGAGLYWHLSQGGVEDSFSLAATILRWLAGLVGLAAMGWMTWQTLKIPNTQSATGILYVALVLVFLGELASALLSFGETVPL